VIEVITAIALLCSVHTDNHYGPEQIQSLQNKCQKELATCIETTSTVNPPFILLRCIKDRK
jgi:hypothetical protein